MKWINVDDRLPTPLQSVIIRYSPLAPKAMIHGCFCGSIAVDVGYMYKTPKNKKPSWRIYGKERVLFSKFVTHWMSLPDGRDAR